MMRILTVAFAALFLAGVFLTGPVLHAAANPRRLAMPSLHDTVFVDDGPEDSARGNSLDTSTKLEMSLTRLQGNWTDGSTTFTVEGSKWKWNGAPIGSVKVVGVVGDVLQVDMYLEDQRGGLGPKIQAIFRRDKETLLYCGTYGPTRPTEFKHDNNHYYIVWKLVVK